MLAGLALGVAPATRPSAEVPQAGVERGAVERAIDPGVEKLAAQLVGAFASTKQSEADKSYFDIRLHMVRIWADRTDGIWLYVEQARADLINKPYRQRVYRVHRLAGGALESAVYLLPGEMEEQQKNWAGAWKLERPLAEISPEKLIAKVGCELVLKEQVDGTYAGATDGKKCPSELNGATYATSEAIVTPAGLRTWDRGYDKDDKQVWGAKKGPYIFDREESAK